MTDTASQHSIPLDQNQVSLTASVMHQAAMDCSATDAVGVPSDDRSVVTLGRMAARWAAISEHEKHCDVVNIHGDRLYNISLTAEEWYHVRAALSEHAARLTRAGGHARTARADQHRARRALLLVDRITEAIAGG
ncbi:hypothetical protein [Streptomyces murinus]|uniref:hypothetical protein n=1 Tax=Streptomyces murinus TaxID=33900 RepID=UPI003F4602A9